MEIDKKVEQNRTSPFVLSLYREQKKARNLCIMFIRGSTVEKNGPGRPTQMMAGMK